MSQARPDVVVIGGGVIGLTTALELAGQGARVTVLERDPGGHHASWAGGGILSPLPPDRTPPGLEGLLEENLALYPGFCARLHDVTGVDPEYWVCGGEFFRDGQRTTYADMAQVRNPRLLKALYARAGQLGIEVRAGEARDLLMEGDRLSGITLADGRLPCRQAVICAGPWSGQAGGPAVAPVKGQMLLFDGRRLGLDRILLDDEAYVIPRRDGVILAGSTLEDAGYDITPTVSARNWLLNQACKLLPELGNAPILDHWAGLRPRLAGELPLIAASAVQRGVYFNTGHYRLGITLAPASARRAAALVLQDL